MKALKTCCVRQKKTELLKLKITLCLPKLKPQRM
jgi:hypothetical protein